MKKETIILLSIILIIAVVIIAYMVIQNNAETQKYEQNIKDSQAQEQRIHDFIDLSIANNPSFKQCYVVNGASAMANDQSNMYNCKNGYCQLYYSYCYDSYCKDLALYCAKKINDMTLFRDLTKLYEG